MARVVLGERPGSGVLVLAHLLTRTPFKVSLESMKTRKVTLGHSVVARLKSKPETGHGDGAPSAGARKPRAALKHKPKTRPKYRDRRTFSLAPLTGAEATR